MKDFKGKRLLVTGAARGIGRLMAERFGRLGASLILTDVQTKLLDNTVRELAAEGLNVTGYPLDVTDEAAILALRDRIHAEHGPVQMLINNAGVVFGGPFLEIPMERHRLTYAVNTMGVVAMTHAFLPDLIASDEGHLVNIASASGLLGLPWGATYASSKWSVLGFSESVRLELKQLEHKHVHVTTVCPSYINTGMFEGAAAPKLTRMLEPDEIADKVVRAVRRNKPRLLTPFMVKTIPFLNGILPRPLAEALFWATGTAASMVEWKGHDAAAKPDDSTRKAG